MLIALQSSYIAALQSVKAIDVPTTSKPHPFFFVSILTTIEDALLGALNQLVESLVGLERILTTPIPFSYVLVQASFPISMLIDVLCRYSVHLWVVAIIYCLAMVRTFILSGFQCRPSDFQFYSRYRSGQP